MITKTKRVHSGWAEYQRLVEYCKKKGVKVPIENHFGKFQYIFEDDKGNHISLIYLTIFGEKWWEIWDGDKLFQDTERFSTKKEAEKRIEVLLNGKK